MTTHDDVSPAHADRPTRTGRYDRQEMQFIEDNVYHLNYREIAERLNRAPEGVKNYIETKLHLKTSLKDSHKPVTKSEYVYELENDELWLTLQAQFSVKELQTFRYHWNQFFTQFGGDVLPTEKLQIIDTIKLELLMAANLEERKTGLEEIADLREKIAQEEEKGDGKNHSLLMDYKKNLTFYQAAQTTLLRDYKDLQDRKAKMFQALKGTRQQRIERIENSKENFTTWMTEIIDNPQRRKELGEHMEKMRLSMIDEQMRLAAYHKYEDGNVDQPLLTPDTVKDDNGRMNVVDDLKQGDTNDGQHQPG